MKNNTNTQRQLAMKSLVLAMAGAGLLSLPQHVLANPTGGQVVAGNVTIRQESATKVGITQTTDKGIIDWQKFSIGANEHVQFYQPSASSVTLNRVVGQDPSQILGRLTANGQIFLVNPNGIFFGKNAQIDVAGLVASTHNIRNEDFLAGKYNFNIPGKPGAAVINEGNIRIADTGIAAFVAPSVANRGVIVARLGKVALSAANGFTLDFHGDQLLSFLVSDDVAKTAFDLEGQQLTSFVENSGRIEAQGGYVLLTAKAAETAIHGVINHSGVIEATTVGTQKGEIILHAGKGSLEVSGTLDASAPNGGDGGFAETSGAKVNIKDGTRISTASATGQTGWWLVDPTNFTIYANSNLPPSSGIAAATLNSMLSITNATIITSGAGTENGDIFVNSPISWSANKLTLSAHGNININADMNARNTASLALYFGQGALAAGNASNIITKGGVVNLPAGTTNFTTKQGSDGEIKSYTVITSLGAERSTSTTDLQGMNGDPTKNYVLGQNIDASATAAWNAGAGFLPIGTLQNTLPYALPFSGVFDGLGHTISNITITGSSYLGLFGETRNATLRNIGMINVSVNGQGGYIGGLVGLFIDSAIHNAFTTGSVVGDLNVGGLVGYGSRGVISNSYAAANVSSDGVVNGRYNGYYLGGLVGRSEESIITDSYATGNVSGRLGLGGLAGRSYYGRISTSYASGNVSGTHLVGGLVGQLAYSDVLNSYYAQIQQQSSYIGWDFVNTWVMSPGGYPVLRNSPRLASVVTPPVTPQPPTSNNTSTVLSRTYIPDAGRYALHITSSVEKIGSDPFGSFFGNKINEISANHAEKVWFAPSYGVYLNKSFERFSGKNIVYSRAELESLSYSELQKINKFGNQKLPDEREAVYWNQRRLNDANRAKELADANVFFATYRDIATLTLQVTSASLEVVAASITPSATVGPNVIDKIKSLITSDSFSRVLDSLGSVVSADEADIFRNMVFGTASLSGLVSKDVLKFMEIATKVSASALDTGAMSNETYMAFHAAMANIGAELSPPGLSKVIFKGLAGVYETVNVANKLQEKANSFVTESKKLVDLKYDAMDFINNKNHVIDLILSNQSNQLAVSENAERLKSNNEIRLNVAYAGNESAIPLVAAGSEYALLANNAYHDKDEVLLPQHIKQVDVIEYPSIGLSATVFVNKNNNKLTIAYRGTSTETVGDTINNIVLDDIGIAAGGVTSSPVFISAEVFANKIASLVEEQKNDPRSPFYGVESIEYTGHSLGGALATYAAIRTGGNAVTFNSAPLGMIQLLAGAASLKTAKVINFNSTNDPLSFSVNSLKQSLGKTVVISNADSGHSIRGLYEAAREVADSFYVE